MRRMGPGASGSVMFPTFCWDKEVGREGRESTVMVFSEGDTAPAGREGKRKDSSWMRERVSCAEALLKRWDTPGCRGLPRPRAACPHLRRAHAPTGALVEGLEPAA